MARQQRLPGSAVPGSSSYHSHPRFPSPGVSSSPGFTAVPGPGYLPQQGPFSGSYASKPKHKQLKSHSSQGQGQMPIAIRPQLQPSHSSQSPYSAVGPLDPPIASPSSSSLTHPSELELLLRARPQNPSSLEERRAESPSSDEAETGTSSRPDAPPRDTWFNYSSHRDSTKSVFDEYQRYKTELAARLEPEDGGKHRGKQKRRQSNGTEKHVSEIRKICEEVEVIKNQLMRAGSLSEEKALEDAMKEMDDLVKFNSRKGMYTFPQAKAYRLTLTKEREAGKDEEEIEEDN